jgi:hypothetical protein
VEKKINDLLASAEANQMLAKEKGKEGAGTEPDKTLSSGVDAAEKHDAGA